METSLILEREGDLALLTLDGPPGNKLTFGFFEAFGELVGEVLPSLSGTAGLVITGRGRHFSSGSDVSELLARAGQAENGCSPSWCEAHASTFRALGQLPYPVVAAIGGCCLGSGLELALACSYRVAADNALLALPEAQHGLIPGLGGALRLTELLGFRQALRLIVSGEPVGADRALELGLVDHVVGRKDLIGTAKRLVTCKTGGVRA